MKLTEEMDGIDFEVLSYIYAIAPLGVKTAQRLKTTFSNSMFKCFIFEEGVLIGAGRALADGEDCSYICDVVVHPQFQGKGLGKKIVTHLMEQSRGHNKIILYANPGKEGFYEKLGFKKMTTAMAVFEYEEEALKRGLIQ